MKKTTMLKKWIWTMLLVSVVGVCVLLYFCGKSNRAVIIFVNKDENSISVSYEHPLGWRHVTFSFDMEHKNYDCSRYCGAIGFELFEVNKIDWSRVPSLFND